MLRRRKGRGRPSEPAQDEAVNETPVGEAELDETDDTVTV